MKFDHALVYDISGLFSPLSFFALGYFIRRFVSETIRELIFRSCVTSIIYHDNIAPPTMTIKMKSITLKPGKRHQNHNSLSFSLSPLSVERWKTTLSHGESNFPRDKRIINTCPSFSHPPLLSNRPYIDTSLSRGTRPLSRSRLCQLTFSIVEEEEEGNTLEWRSLHEKKKERKKKILRSS